MSDARLPGQDHHETATPPTPWPTTRVSRTADIQRILVDNPAQVYGFDA